MRHDFIGASLLLASFFLLPAVTEAQGKRKKAPKDTEAPLDSAKLAPGEFTGKLKTVPGTDRLFVVAAEFKSLKQTSKGRPGRIVTPRGASANVQQIIRLQNQIQQAQMQAARARTPQQYMQQLQRAQQLQVQLNQALLRLQLSGGAGPRLVGAVPPGYTIVTNTRDIEFQASEKVKVRTMVLEDEFDEKGNVKKRTKSELAALKGKDKSLPGYESSLEKLTPGQKVRVTLATFKKPTKPGAKDKAKEDIDKDVQPEEKKMQVKLIVILEEPKSDSAADRPGKRKKK
jgi:hypothetical protein